MQNEEGPLWGPLGEESQGSLRIQSPGTPRWRGPKSRAAPAGVLAAVAEDPAVGQRDMLVRLSWLSSPFRPAPAPCPLPPTPPLPPQYSCSLCRSVTRADPRQAPLGAWGPPGSWSSSVATPAMPSSVGSRVIGPARRPAVVAGMAGEFMYIGI